MKKQLHKVVSNYYNYLFLNSSLSKWNLDSKIMNCPICSSSNLFFVCNKLLKRFEVIYELDFNIRELYYLRFENISKTIIKNEIIKKMIRFFVSSSDKRSAIIYGLNCLRFKSTVSFYKCNDCKNIFQNFPHTNESILNYYENYYRCISKKNNKSFRENRGVYKQFSMISSYILKYIKKGKVLEIGCAEGVLLKMLSDRGFDVFGIDPNKEHIINGTNILKLNNLKNGLYDVDLYKPDFFDLIFSNHVVEHLPNLIDFVKTSYLHLKSNGLFLIYTPCSESIICKMNLGVSCQEISALGFGHTVIYSIDYIIDVLLQNNFEILNSRYIYDQNLSYNGRYFLEEGIRDCGMFILAKKV